ncbi:glutamate receptor 3.7-like [Pyrus ussuriensis x Pyrus communis]|uniref:Glutamate receptor 3.7-like n=1 Tax=Pyrus ussuriensis x Pyrus communis TaxID=2448454 RepID=A0A5N5HT66_9ROSA|nr:glutamate receptor 3.7-like [Pyrus ussuriensis x Pyrus communis]
MIFLINLLEHLYSIWKIQGKLLLNGQEIAVMGLSKISRQGFKEFKKEIFCDLVYGDADGLVDDSLAIEPLGLGSTDEELRFVGSGTSVGHRQNSGSGVLLDEVLVARVNFLEVFDLSSKEKKNSTIMAVLTLKGFQEAEQFVTNKKALKAINPTNLAAKTVAIKNKLADTYSNIRGYGIKDED